MAVIINATTTTGLTTSADNSGVIQFQSNGANTVGISSTGYITIGGNQQIAGPAFRAYINAATQTVTAGATTKITLTGETFDTANCFDSTTNYRFTPNVPGYYQFNGAVSNAVGTDIIVVFLYKNGSVYVTGSDTRSTNNSLTSNVSEIVYMNGTTDYVELYGYINSKTAFDGGGTGRVTYFSGAMVRGA